PLIALLIRLFGRKVKKNSTQVQNATADVTSTYHETLLCLKVVQGFFTGKRESERFSELAENLYKKVMRWNRWHLGLGPLMDTVVFLVLPAILIIGKVYFHHTLGELLAMAYAFSRVYRPIKRLALVNNHIKTLQGATERVFQIMQTVPDIRDTTDAKVLSQQKGTLEFDHVNFAYAPTEPVLRDVSFKLKEGEMAAFVGSTGAGKSTLLDLIPRFYDVTGGAILIDGNDVRDVTLKSLRKRIGIVNQ
ncbi:MAG: ABC transporter ATP-binding protein, partial [Deltaproteobacteria bacterium]|nr:ABC transporter ATP-binding protein [Deltaproteobacteria bacterium]